MGSYKNELTMDAEEAIRVGEALADTR